MKERVYDIFGTVREIPASMVMPISCWPPPSKKYALQCAKHCWSLVPSGLKGAEAQSWIWLFRWAGFRKL